MLTLDFSNRVMSKNYSRNTANEIQQPFSSEIWDILPSVFKPLHTRDYANIFEKLLSVHDININENPKTLPLVNELLHLIISDAYHAFTDAENNQTSMDEACSYIKTHFSEEIRLDDIAGHIHLCKNYLVRQFKKAYGVSPISYLIRVRMDYAKKLLLETNLPIKTVAAECGYNDPAFFNYYFKKTFSVTPKAYRSTFKI
jgi:YesN/AraC family two-component response regulator